MTKNPNLKGRELVSNHDFICVSIITKSILFDKKKSIYMYIYKLLMVKQKNYIVMYIISNLYFLLNYYSIVI